MTTDRVDQSKWAIPRLRTHRASASLAKFQRPRCVVQGVWCFWLSLRFFVMDATIPHDSNTVIEQGSPKTFLLAVLSRSCPPNGFLDPACIASDFASESSGLAPRAGRKKLLTSHPNPLTRLHEQETKKCSVRAVEG